MTEEQVSQAIEHALWLHQQGRLAEAEQIYRRVIWFDTPERRCAPPPRRSWHYKVEMRPRLSSRFRRQSRLTHQLHISSTRSASPFA